MQWSKYFGTKTTRGSALLSVTPRACVSHFVCLMVLFVDQEFVTDIAGMSDQCVCGDRETPSEVSLISKLRNQWRGFLSQVLSKNRIRRSGVFVEFVDHSGSSE